MPPIFSSMMILTFVLIGIGGIIASIYMESGQKAGLFMLLLGGMFAFIYSSIYYPGYTALGTLFILGSIRFRNSNK
ncbi:hypothetical protein [Sphingobacterium suaedae]